ncbi:hypothetical protein K7432_011979 [Basidiobolus ranarum]|uniref:Tyrosinase copper-binding domain-containing protein n=1 Tax=Basidiobolus ranarum TaxID=34480 RepID=A0ABR2VT10_9FUNG
MKGHVFFVVMCWCFLAINPLFQAFGCEQITQRREIHELSDLERQNLINALKELKESGEYDRLTQVHVLAFKNVHGKPSFFPWHRKSLREFELALQQIDPSLSLPYWDWTLDSQAPETSKVFEWFGGNGSSDDNCVGDFPLPSWETVSPNESCLRRQFTLDGSKIPPFYPPEIIEEAISDSESFEELRHVIEMGPHGSVHIGINGHMSQYNSPNDPLFWLHHAFIDKIWADWQNRHGDLVEHYASDEHSIQDTLPQFSTRVEEVLSVSSLCYEYVNTQSASDSNNETPQTRMFLNRFSEQLKRIWKSTQAFPKDFIHPPDYSKIYGGPNANDRTEVKLLRYPLGLPTEYVDMMGWNLTLVRKYESKFARIISEINRTSEYLSPAALVRRDIRQRMKNIWAKVRPWNNKPRSQNR